VESVGRLAGGIAHDFNNYLTVIRGYCELVRQRLIDPKAQEEIGYVEDAADKATNLTRQLLAFGRRQVLRPVALDLNAVVRDTRKLLDSLLGEDVSLQLDLEQDLDQARADLGQTEQVLMNLAVNGRDAMPRGGTLSVRTRRVTLTGPEAVDLDLEPGSYVGLEIADTGSGMSVEVMEQAFEPFFTTKGPGRGTGLGLSTVHGIVAQSGGAISLKSAQGEGTTVRVLFPTATGRAEPESTTTVRPQRASVAATLMVVEDDEQVRSLAVSALTDAGFRVHQAASGRDALERCAGIASVDLLITDVMMPEMDGARLADLLGARFAGLRVLFISGYPADTLRDRQAVLPESIELLEKPFTGTTLVAKAQQVLARRPPPGSHGGMHEELKVSR
jgi:CheY-like chemotaxis protein